MARQPAPKDRSIFRKNIGRALLHQRGDVYLAIWDRDFTTHAARDAYGSLRDIAKEQALASEITAILRETFAFRSIQLEKEAERFGNGGVEAALIGTVAQCRDCRPSAGWLGLHSPVEKIRSSGLWLSQHLSAPPVTAPQCHLIEKAIGDTQTLPLS